MLSLPLFSPLGCNPFLRSGKLSERAFVFFREQLDEAQAEDVPLLENVMRAAAAGIARMILDHALQYRLIGEPQVPEVARYLGLLFGLRQHWLDLNHRRIAVLDEVAVLVENVGDAARHAGREIAAGRAEYRHRTAGHVLAAMVADAFHHRLR